MTKDLPKRDREKIGKESESNVEKALQELKKKGDIEGFRRTKKFSVDDLNKIDFFIFSPVCRIKLQVKSSYDRKEEHERHSGIPCIVGKHNIHYLKEWLIKIIRREEIKYLRKKSKGTD